MDIRRFGRSVWAWALGNLLWNGVMAAWAVGGSALITAIVGALVAVFIGMPTPFLVLMLVGVFLLGLAGMPTAGQQLRIGQPQTKAAVGLPAEPALAARTIQQVEAPAFRFDPYSVSGIVGGIDLAGLFRPESYALITMHIRNVSGCVVNITGVTGRLLCCQEECNMPITVERAPRVLSTLSSDRSAVTIRQPLSDGMMQMIALRGIQGNGTLVFSLASLKWVGTVETSAGTAPLEGCYVFQGEVLVQGPIQDANDGVTLFALQRKFVSSQWYTDDGQPRER